MRIGILIISFLFGCIRSEPVGLPAKSLNGTLDSTKANVPDSSLMANLTIVLADSLIREAFMLPRYGEVVGAGQYESSLSWTSTLSLVNELVEEEKELKQKIEEVRRKFPHMRKKLSKKLGDIQNRRETLLDRMDGLTSSKFVELDPCSPEYVSNLFKLCKAQVSKQYGRAGISLISRKVDEMHRKLVYQLALQIFESINSSAFTTDALIPPIGFDSISDKDIGRYIQQVLGQKDQVDQVCRKVRLSIWEDYPTKKPSNIASNSMVNLLESDLKALKSTKPVEISKLVQKSWKRFLEILIQDPSIVITAWMGILSSFHQSL